MSEPSLSDREMAILAGLAARAEAADPRLAHVLRGHRRWLAMRLPALPAAARHWSFGLVAALIGLAVMVATLATSLPAAVAGALLLFAGAGWLAAALPAARRPQPAPSAPDRGSVADD